MGLLFVLCAQLPFEGCNNSTQPIQSHWTISGKTYYIGCRSPLPGVLIKCAGLSVTSGSDGSYLLTDISEGTQVITAQATNCLNYTDTVSIQGDTKRYIFMSPAPVSLTGSVTNIIDGPVIGAKVELHGIFVYTDTSGRYDLREISLGTDTLYVSHPDYIAYKAAVTLTALAQKSDVVLTRERIVQGTLTEDAFVNVHNPNTNYSSNQVLALSITGTLPTQFLTGHNIYLKFTFPPYFVDPRVTILNASLELLMYSSAPQFSSYATYAVSSTWSRGTITYNTQPTLGVPLSSGPFGDGSSGKYWSFLKTAGVNTLLADWRANKTNDGIVIQGGAKDLSVTYFYGLESLASPPRITFTVRY